MRATVVNDGRKIGLILLDEYIGIVVRIINGGGFSNVTDVACDRTKAPTLLDCTTFTLVTGAGAATYLWADPTHLSAGASSRSARSQPAGANNRSNN